MLFRSTLLLERPDTRIVILDDAFQHRRIRPDLNILLTRYDQPFHNDLIFPVGWLREARVGARRADVVDDQICYRAGSLSGASICFQIAQTISSPPSGRAGRSWAGYSFVTA